MAKMMNATKEIKTAVMAAMSGMHGVVVIEDMVGIARDMLSADISAEDVLLDILRRQIESTANKSSGSFDKNGQLDFGDGFQSEIIQAKGRMCRIGDATWTWLEIKSEHQHAALTNLQNKTDAFNKKMEKLRPKMEGDLSVTVSQAVLDLGL